jgi:hypothetical protein
MSPCCIAAAALTALITALIVVGLTGFVLATDGFGLGLLTSTLLAAALQWGRMIGPCPLLLHGLSALLAVRAVWLLASTRRHLLVAVFRRVRPLASKVVGHVRPGGSLRADKVIGGLHAGHHAGPSHADGIGCHAHRTRMN